MHIRMPAPVPRSALSAFAVAALAIAGLTACGPATEDTSPPKTVETTSSEPTPEPTEPPVNGPDRRAEGPVGAGSDPASATIYRVAVNSISCD